MGDDFKHYDLNYKQFLPNHYNASILDVGCGHGRTLAYLAENGYKNLTGMDHDEEVLTHARSLGKAKIHHVKDFESFFKMAPSEKYDLIIAKDVIYYFPREKIIQWLSLLKAALKPNGKLIVEIFNGASWTGPLLKYKDYHIRWIFTEHSLQNVLVDAGFRVEFLSGVVTPRETVKQLSFALLTNTWRLILRTIYFLERGFNEQNPKILNPKLISVSAL